MTTRPNFQPGSREEQLEYLIERLHFALSGGNAGEISAFPKGGGGFKGGPRQSPARKHRPLRWGYTGPYAFTLASAQLNPPFNLPGELYFQSPLIVAADVGRPLRWSLHAQFTFDQGIQAQGGPATPPYGWTSDANLWEFAVVLQAGVGQGNPTIINLTQYTPSTGVGTTYGPTPPFQTQDPYASLDIDLIIPAEKLYVSVVITGERPSVLNQGVYSGYFSVIAAPYFSESAEVGEVGL